MPSTGSCVSHSHSLSHKTPHRAKQDNQDPQSSIHCPEAAALQIQQFPGHFLLAHLCILGTCGRWAHQGGCRSLWSSTSLWRVNSTQILLTTGGESDLEINVSVGLWEGWGGERLRKNWLNWAKETPASRPHFSPERAKT